ncbi:MAG: glycosyltransferase family 4 protein [Myxococcales bacterium]|nr:glycosyltransferase family 4 protein [Myxococcales bacterium]
MRYLVAVDTHFLDYPGGAARVAWDMALAARDAGHKVAMLSYHTDPSLPTSFEHVEGIDILRVPPSTLPAWNPLRLFESIHRAKQGILVHLGTNWDIAHIHNTRTGWAICEALGEKTRILTTVHSPVLLEYQANQQNQTWLQSLKHLLGVPLLTWLEQQILQRSHRIHTLSDFTRQELLKLYGMQDKISVMPYWRRPGLQRTHTQVEARTLLGWPQEIPIFFTVRFHGPRTGIDDAIHATAPLTETHDFRFYIAGDGPLRTHHEGLVQHYHANDKIHFLGRISEEDLDLAYQAADAFLLPTRALECFGLISIEALSFGCPVISSDSSAIPEVLAPILPAFLYPTGDITALQGKIRAFLQGQLQAPAPEVLIQYIEEHYSYQRLLPTFLEILSSP